MRVIPFSIPKDTNEAFRVQIDESPRLYDYLHAHPEIQLTCIIESEGTLIAGDYIGRFEPGDVFEEIFVLGVDLLPIHVPR